MPWIKNFKALATSPQRNRVLTLAEKAFAAINTENIVKHSVKLNGQKLKILNRTFDLKKFKRILVLGFGKASPKAAKALESVLKNKITNGVVIGTTKAQTKKIQSFIGTHPLPSAQNVKAAKKMTALIKRVSEKDLIITLVSGGGSALLCWDKEERAQGKKLYENILKTGEDIKTLNIVRKHLSQVKGGGLAKLLYPATVVSLIFSDVPGDDFASVASGPTYFDTSTVNQAKKIINKYSLGTFKLYETPKDKKYFKKIHNIPLISNHMALKKMAQQAKKMGLQAKILSTAMYDPANKLLKKLKTHSKTKTVILGGGEAKIIVTKNTGSGGRCQYLGMKAFEYLKEGEIFLALASDGVDNSNCGGVIIDALTLKQAAALKFNYKQFLKNFDGYRFFQKLGNTQIFTGPTEANIADLFIWYKD